MAIAVVVGGCASRSVEPGAPSAALAERLRCVAAETPERFAFRSSFWLNLHNHLYREARLAAGVPRRGRGADPFGNFALELEGTHALSATESETWRRAVTFYRDVALVRGLRDSSVVLVNNALGSAASARDITGLPVEPEWIDALLGAAPVYRDVWWPVHDSANRAWIGDAEALLHDHLGCLDGALATALDSVWESSPLQVDVSVYASWFGAYTTLSPTHITLSSTAYGNRGSYALEALLHEAGHALLPATQRELAESAAARGVALVPELPHLLLFFTAGELVRARLPGHVPFAFRFDTWRRSPETQRLLGVLRREWLPWLEGRRSREEAVGGLMVGTRRPRPLHGTSGGS